MKESLLSSLKKRRIWKTMVAYPAASFVILQAVDFFISKYGLDSRALTFTLIVLIGGFVIALIWNWFHGEEGQQRYFRREIASYIVIASISLVAAILFSKDEQSIIVNSVLSDIETYRLAVLPFETDENDASLTYLSEGIPENLINSLSHSTNLQLVSRASSFLISPDAQDAKAIREKLNANLMLTGSIERVNASLVVSCQLINTENQSQLWGDKVAYNNSDVLKLEKEITSSLLNSLPEKFKKTVSGSSAVSTIPEAQAHYMKGRALSYGSTAEETQQALNHFRDAIKIDPKFVAAYVAIANEQVVQAMFATDSDADVFNEARLAVQTALGLDPFYAEAYTVDASIKFYSDRDWDAAEVSYKKAIELDPNNANALIRYSFFLSTLKRYEEALSLAEKAVVIDPISRSSLHGLAWVYLLDGQFMAAEKTFNNALEIHPNWTWGYIKRAYSKLFQGQCESAYEDTEKARSLIGDWGSELLESCFIYIYAKCDFNEEKNEHVDRFLTRVNETNYNNPMALGLVNATIGDTEESIKWHQIAIDEKNTGFYQFTIDWAYPDQILEDPRFIEMKRKLDLPQ